MYVEDSPVNVEQLRADGHPTIVFDNSTNGHLPGPRADSWEEVYRLVAKEMASWKASMAARRLSGG
jgi:hypothetical protein